MLTSNAYDYVTKIKYARKERGAEFVRFCVAGFITFLLDYSLMYFFTSFLGIQYLISSACSFVIAISINYILCIGYVFKTVNVPPYQRGAMFFCFSVLGLLVTQIGMYVLVEIVLLHYMLAKLLVVAVVMFMNYVLKRKAVVG